MSPTNLVFAGTATEALKRVELFTTRELPLQLTARDELNAARQVYNKRIRANA